MRIVTFFFQSIVFLGLLAGVIYFFGGQVWMMVALRTFENDLEIITDSASTLDSQRKRCQNAPAASVYASPKALQLRFISDQEYVVELLCTLIEGTPIPLAQGVLPIFVHKAPGSSGLYYDYEHPTTASLVLSAMRARKEYRLEANQKISTSYRVRDTQPAASLPATSCAGWGYLCCQADGQKGAGDAQKSGVTDCPSRCFNRCVSTPYIQGFVSDPFPNGQNTVLMTTDSLQVTFSYTAGIASGKIASVEIDYGDGTRDTSQETTGVFTHTYTCQGPCRYKAVVTAMDESSNRSVENDVSTIYIVRR